MGILGWIPQKQKHLTPLGIFVSLDHWVQKRAAELLFKLAGRSISAVLCNKNKSPGNCIPKLDNYLKEKSEISACPFQKVLSYEI